MTDRNTQLVILARGLQAVTDEMAANLIRSAFSAVVREARDCSTALLDAQGRVVAQVERAGRVLAVVKDRRALVGEDRRPR